jgi:signal transduction histidine kinase/DNA-binding response OmpR family regulator
MTRPLTGIRWWNYGSLRWRFLLVGIVSLAPIMAVTNQVYTDARESALASTRQSVELLAALAAQSDNDVIADARMLLSFLAEAPEVRRGGAACDTFLARHSTSYKWISLLRFSNLDGSRVCGDRPEIAVSNVSDQSYFKEALQRSEFVVSEFLVQPPTGHLARLAAVPVNHEGRVVGVLSLGIDPDVFGRWSFPRDIAPNISMFIVDRHGVLIARYPPEPALLDMDLRDRAVVRRALERPTGVDELPDLLGAPRLFAFRRLPSTDAVLAIGLSRESVIQPLDDALRQRFIVIAALIAASLLLALLGGELFIFRQLRRLGSAAGAIEAGDFSARAAVQGAGEVGVLARALDRMAEALSDRDWQLRLARQTAEKVLARAQEADKAKTEFLASMSHEIRTPLHGIIGYTERLLDERLTSDQRRYAERIEAAGSSLLTVVNDILDLSQVEAGRIDLEIQPFSLEALIDDAVSIVSEAAVPKGLPIRVSLDRNLPKMLLGDEARLRQILLNLLNNAVKFTHQGHIALAVRWEGRKDHREVMRFSVTDTGIGIAPENQNRLFARFSQVDGTIRREFGGTGLGLAISKRLIELMGGEIGLESETGRGSSFWITVALPRTEAFAGEQAAEGAPTTVKAGRILVAEDIEMNRELTRSILETAGHQVDVVSNGIEAVAAVQAQSYDLVFMDIQMPRMDGIAATKEIRTLDHPARGIPIIAMTANVMPQQVRSYKEAGMNDYVGKPMKRNHLINKTNEWLRKAAVVVQAPSDKSRRSFPVFDQEAFTDFVNLMGHERVAEWLTRLKKQLSDTFFGNKFDQVDREELARSAHAIISQAAILGFAELAELCGQLQEACDSSRNLSLPIQKAQSASNTARDMIDTMAERLAS